MQSFFFFWRGSLAYAVTVSGAGRIIFKQLNGCSFWPGRNYYYYFIYTVLRAVWDPSTLLVGRQLSIIVEGQRAWNSTYHGRCVFLTAVFREKYEHRHVQRHIHMHIHIHVHIHTHAYTYTYTYMCVYMYMCVYVSLCFFCCMSRAARGLVVGCGGWRCVVFCCRHVVVVVVLVLGPSCFVWWASSKTVHGMCCPRPIFKIGEIQGFLWWTSKHVITHMWANFGNQKIGDKRWTQHPVKMLEKCKKSQVLPMKHPPSSSPVCPSNTSRVYVQNVPVYAGTTRTCFNMCARGAGTHGDVSNVHTRFLSVSQNNNSNTTQHNTTQHNTPQQRDHNTSRRQRQTETEREEGTKEKKTRQEQREERRVKREDSFSVWWCMAVLCWWSALSC